MLKECGLDKYFDVYISGDDFKESKPNPEIYLTTAKILNSDIKNCVVFEDSEKGLMSAKDAGMKTIGVKHKFLISDLSSADYIIGNFEEINLEKIIKIRDS